jgi:hypothetical protein
MNQNNQQETIPVPRSRIFVLDDGTFVVQWEAERVQDLLNGRYQTYNPEQFGNSITDYELGQLQKSEVVADYDAELVYLSPMTTTDAQHPNRSFYLNTTLHKSRVKDVEQALKEADLLDRLSVRIQAIFVIVRGERGYPFASFDDAERAREVLIEAFPELLGNTVVAFIEHNSLS